ncbi:MAG: DUF2117 domain-containing protein [Proteobacteria bacterium]|nr:DUF2117 domain-containing protein [Pseudomonadota bacterium]MBU1388986.1 DUF2117 domain-containing protein [Pseudomonadota bacterium]MBU1543538.1 DUF2117 domain-containing protein [Pseudomonadota bacterium]MBU2480660.1 DUF2117 domain-containing protein [Pseudomonadota bacterium]
MIGLLFHGPEVFDSGWAKQIIDAVKSTDSVQCVLAGTMGRTAVFDSGLDNITFWNKMPGECLRDLSSRVSMVLIVNFGKSVDSGLVFGGMVVERSEVKIPVVQVECSGPFFVEWIKGSPSHVLETLRQMGLSQKEKIEIMPSVWEADGKIYRRMTTAETGDFVLVDGIMVGRATGEDVVIACQNGHICEIRGVLVKEHGIEKLDRLGGVELKTAKLASTPSIRRTCHTPRMVETNGQGIVFIDHAGMHVYDLMNDAKGVVTVGDDTTVVAADILSRFKIPVIGIVDGDEDVVLKNGSFAPGSVKLTVLKDDEFGLKIFDAVFNGKKHINMGFSETLNRILELAGNDLLEQQYY